MASIHKYGKKWHIYFRFGGSQFKPSLKATNKKEAEARLAVVEETIRMIVRNGSD